MAIFLRLLLLHIQPSNSARGFVDKSEAWMAEGYVQLYRCPSKGSLQKKILLIRKTFENPPPAPRKSKSKSWVWLCSAPLVSRFDFHFIWKAKTFVSKSICNATQAPLSLSIAASRIPQRTCYTRQKSSKHEAKPVVSYYYEYEFGEKPQYYLVWKYDPWHGCHNNEKLGMVADRLGSLRQRNGNRDWVINGYKQIQSSLWCSL